MCTANYLANTGDVEWVQHYVSVDARKRSEPGVAGDPLLVWTGLYISFVELICSNSGVFILIVECGGTVVEVEYFVFT